MKRSEAGARFSLRGASVATLLVAAFWEVAAVSVLIAFVGYSVGRLTPVPDSLDGYDLPSSPLPASSVAIDWIPLKLAVASAIALGVAVLMVFRGRVVSCWRGAVGGVLAFLPVPLMAYRSAPLWLGVVSAGLGVLVASRTVFASSATGNSGES